MSYMDRVGGVPRAGAPPETSPPPPPTTTSPRRPGSSNLPRAPSASSRVATSRSTAAPTQPSLNFTVRREQVSFTKICIHLSILALLPSHPHSSVDPSCKAKARMTAGSLTQDRAAVQDTHIHHLRHQIESRLKVGARTGRLATQSAQNYCCAGVPWGGPGGVSNGRCGSLPYCKPLLSQICQLHPCSLPCCGRSSSYFIVECYYWELQHCTMR